MGTECFHVTDKMVGGVNIHVCGGIAGVRNAASGTTLVKENDTITFRVKGSSHSWGAAGARTTMHDQRRLAFWIAAGLPIHLVVVRDGKHAT